MRRVVVFLAALLLGLGLLSTVGYLALTRAMSRWFEADLDLRSQLAVVAAERSLARHWNNDSGRLAAALADITRDERIMGAAACTPGGELLAATEAYPAEFSCRSVLDRMARESGAGATTWSMRPELPAGAVHLSVMMIGNGSAPDGAVVLVHDLKFLNQRETTTRNLWLVAVVLMSIAASAITLAAARFFWRGWLHDLERALIDGTQPAFQPLARDLRALVERLAAEREEESYTGPWSPDRLRSALHRYLHGERVVIVANREPYIHEETPDGGVRVVHPASGLVTALEPVVRACSGTWVAHGSGSADRATVDQHDRVPVPPGEESYLLRRVWLTDEEEDGYYYGFSNEGLWPLCHVAHTRPEFRAADWEHYIRANRKFAAAVCEEVDREDPIIFVQDYHLALAPRMIRERLPRATIIAFWHIPWPSAERIGICPWREALISGLLGSSILGFQTQQHCNNFIDAVDGFMESRIDRERYAVVQGGRRTLVRPYPISIEWPVHWLEGLPPAAECRVEVLRELGLAEDALLCVGVDRLDYTKGIEERILALDDLLRRHPDFRGRASLVQLAAPSRTKIGRYKELNERVEALAAKVNAEWASGAYRPVILLRAHHEPQTVFRFYRAANACYVSSLHDGMNLVAKEFVAARDDLQGVLVLSQFTGAARDLSEALIVNPYDVRQAGDALALALRMSPAEQRERMESMRRLIAEFNVYRWAGRMLIDAAELRRRERLAGRFARAAAAARASAT